MDLGIAGKRAIVCASSKGLGRACAVSLAREGASVLLSGRNEASLTTVADQIESETGNRPDYVVSDLSTADGRKAVLAAAPDATILVNNNGGPPPGQLGDWSNKDWHDAVEANMICGIEMIEGVLQTMKASKFGRIVNITSGIVKAPQMQLALSTTARAGLTAFSKALSREVASHNITINNLLPGMVATDRIDQLVSSAAQRAGQEEDAIRAAMTSRIPAKTFGEPADFGDLCAFLCAAQSGYVTGQNITVDGGVYEGLI